MGHRSNNDSTPRPDERILGLSLTHEDGTLWMRASDLRRGPEGKYVADAKAVVSPRHRTGIVTHHGDAPVRRDESGHVRVATDSPPLEPDPEYAADLEIAQELDSHVAELRREYDSRTANGEILPRGMEMELYKTGARYLLDRWVPVTIEPPAGPPGGRQWGEA